jgi:hypothetical protein
MCARTVEVSGSCKVEMSKYSAPTDDSAGKTQALMEIME